MTSKLKEVAYRYVRHKLISGDFTGGRDLSSQTIGKELGMSRTPVREALSQLEREGLLESVPRSGIYHKQLSPVEVSDLYELRTAVESVAAAQAARRATRPQIEALERCCRQFDRRAQTLQRSGPTGTHDPQLAEIDLKFHQLVFAAAANRFAKDVFETMHLQTVLLHVNLRLEQLPERYAQPSYASLDRIVSQSIKQDSFTPMLKAPFREVLFNTAALASLSGKQHTDLCRAIRASDVESSAELMRRHLVYARLLTAARCHLMEESSS